MGDTQHPMIGADTGVESRIQTVTSYPVVVHIVEPTASSSPFQLAPIQYECCCSLLPAVTTTAPLTISPPNPTTHVSHPAPTTRGGQHHQSRVWRAGSIAYSLTRHRSAHSLLCLSSSARLASKLCVVRSNAESCHLRTAQPTRGGTIELGWWHSSCPDAATVHLPTNYSPQPSQQQPSSHPDPTPSRQSTHRHRGRPLRRLDPCHRSPRSSLLSLVGACLIPPPI